MSERVHGGHEVCAVGRLRRAAGRLASRFRVEISTVRDILRPFVQVNT